MYCFAELAEKADESNPGVIDAIPEPGRELKMSDLWRLRSRRKKKVSW